MQAQQYIQAPREDSRGVIHHTASIPIQEYSFNATNLQRLSAMERTLKNQGMVDDPYRAAGFY